MKKKQVWTKEDTLRHLKANIVEVQAVDGFSPCWEWQKNRTRDGYGQFGSPGAELCTGQKLTHRAMYALHHGFTFTDRAQQVMHECHNRPCCNPDHLKLGTAKENMMMAVARGLSTHGIRYGEENHCSKLTEQDVRAMRDLKEEFGCTYRVIAEMFGVVNTTAQDVCKRRTWTHVK